ncbi:MAG TPA: cell division protein ZapE [Alcanivoracaceae bacterium]|nr:cell division protein ZapE [Alcanivoracaceae bacterium]
MRNTLSPQQQYQQALAEGFVPDVAQAEAVERLQQCFTNVEAGQLSQGVYLWGPVGRGKTWLMDSFYRALTVPARRQHFHHFMKWLHKRLFALTGTKAPLQQVANELAQEVEVLCFDEFFVNDIGDAMLLGPLLQALFARGLVLVATSNEPPEALYQGGFNRARFLPAIQALMEHMTVVHLDGGQDHRLHGASTQQRYWVNSGHFEQLFQQKTGAAAKAATISLGQRELAVRGEQGEVVWCDYSNLCEGNWSALDYIELCERYKTVLLSAVPCLSAAPAEQYIARGTEDGATRVAAGDRHLVALSQKDNGVRRFIALVDECYEQQVPLYIDAQVPLPELYEQGALLFPFRRTRSRLEAMQRAQFGQH